MKLNKHTRKTPCPDCGVKGGSRHSPRCPWAHAKQPDHKTLLVKRMTLRQKLKATAAVWKS